MKLFLCWTGQIRTQNLVHCIPLTVLIVSIKSQNFCKNGCPKISNIPVYFRYVLTYRQGFPYEKYWMYRNCFAISEFSEYVENLEKNRNFCQFLNFLKPNFWNFCQFSKFLNFLKLNFWNFCQFLKSSNFLKPIFAKIFVKIFGKFCKIPKAKIRRLIFGQFSAVKIFGLSTFAKDGIMKISGQHSSLICTL